MLGKMISRSKLLRKLLTTECAPDVIGEIIDAHAGGIVDTAVVAFKNKIDDLEENEKTKEKIFDDLLIITDIALNEGFKVGVDTILTLTDNSSIFDNNAS